MIELKTSSVGRNFVPFRRGMTGFGIKIIRADVDKRRGAKNAMYLVRYTCCGKEAELSHAQITSRVRHRYTTCAQCVLQKQKKYLPLTNAQKKRRRIEQQALQIALSHRWLDTPTPHSLRSTALWVFQPNKGHRDVNTAQQ